MEDATREARDNMISRVGRLGGRAPTERDGYGPGYLPDPVDASLGDRAAGRENKQTYLQIL